MEPQDTAAGAGGESAGDAERPDALRELVRLPQWVLWRREERGGRMTKVPYDPNDPARRASVDDPATWSSLKVAVPAMEKLGFDGVGFVFTRDDPYAGVDLDDCRDPETGEITAEARRWVEKLSSYTEVSPSGRGLKCWVRGRMLRGIHPKGYGAFSERRYFCFTGEHLEGTPETIEERQPVLDELYRELAPPRASAPPNGNGHARAPAPSPVAVSLGDRELLGKIRASVEGSRFQALWDGDTSGYASRSEADLALSSMLAFWTGGDPGRIDRLFRRSGLYREKWEREGYRDATIQKALEGKREFYGGGGAAVAAGGGADGADAGDDIDDAALAADPWRPFPLEALPGVVREYTERGAESIGCDPAYIALPLLSALAAAVGNTRRLRLKLAWSEPAIVWTCLVGESGTMKSPAFEIALRPVRAAQTRSIKRHTERMERYREEKLLYEKELARWKRSKDDGLPPAEPEAPTSPRTWCDDTTVEALASRLAENPRGLLMVRDELSGWLGGFDRYSQAKGTGGGSDVAKWLEVYGGREMAIDRKTGPHTMIHIPRAAVSIAGGIQPGILRRALSQQYFDNGLAARLLLASPPARVALWSETDIDTGLQERLDRLFERLYSLRSDEDPDGDPEPRMVALSPGGKEAWVEFHDGHAREQVELAGELAAAWSKLKGYAARLALVVHMVRWAGGELAPGDEDSVDERSVAAGATLSRWFGGEALRIYRMLSESEEEEASRRLLELIERKGGRVTAREVQQSSRLFPTAADATEALEQLVEEGLGEWVTLATNRGRPRREFRLGGLQQPGGSDL